MRQYPAAWLKGQSRGEAIAGELRLRIVEGTLKQGDIVSENKIAADFGTSRSPVREALKALSNEGLIRLERMGAVVLGLSAEDVAELYDVRYLIESFAQRRLASSCPAELIASLRHRVDSMRVAAKYADIAEFAWLDFQFHDGLIATAGHARIARLWDSIRHVVLAVMLLTTEDVFAGGPDRLQRVVAKHEAIADALAAGDEARIAKVVQDYFADSRLTLRSAWS
ncbi:GntR family transcriptional regulator [Cohnella rhizosphaerae]|uniref:GntR family transcriptional regulator n=1 Tax=Cohnella rhizosphaerae TaxID=1457232 RepID=A0A9X4QR80_9BACL|nr:GntR family transcriptional regulator [Cohnella rhizosphaerae]MDG0807973.1 GntR family transcriptional regulator [Cohnella rhizosphaerae]